MNRKITADEMGFTLLEVVITVSLLVVILSAGYSVFLGGLHAWWKSEEKVDAQQRVRYAVQRMVKEVQEAERVVAGEGYLYPHWYRTGEECLFLEKPGGEIVVFYLLKNSELLRRSVLAGGRLEGNNELAYGISKVEFQYNGDSPENSSVIGILVKSAEGYELFTKAHLRLFRR